MFMEPRFFVESKTEKRPKPSPVKGLSDITKRFKNRENLVEHRGQSWKPRGAVGFLPKHHSSVVINMNL